MSVRAPISGALRNDRIPLRPCIKPFARNVLSGNVLFKTVITLSVRRPHAKNSRNITMSAWTKLGLPMPDNYN